MSKMSSVIGRACSGLASRSFHPGWQDVSPVPVGKTRADHERERRAWKQSWNEQTKRLKAVKVWRNGKLIEI